MNATRVAIILAGLALLAWVARDVRHAPTPVARLRLVLTFALAALGGYLLG